MPEYLYSFLIIVLYEDNAKIKKNQTVVPIVQGKDMRAWLKFVVLVLDLWLYLIHKVSAVQANSQNMHVLIRAVGVNEEIPYHLLLLADPDKQIIDDYLKASALYVATIDDKIVGVLVLYPLSAHAIEIKNIAVAKEMQGKGIGKQLLDEAVKIARQMSARRICIGTANSSIAQLYLYQKKGFEISAIRKNFFTDNYPDPIYENGIQAKHFIVLTREM